jgi:hypothetical protein
MVGHRVTTRSGAEDWPQCTRHHVRRRLRAVFNVLRLCTMCVALLEMVPSIMRVQLIYASWNARASRVPGGQAWPGVNFRRQGILGHYPHAQTIPQLWSF